MHVPHACMRLVFKLSISSCPPIHHQLEGEDPLLYRVLMAIDGNESAKRVDNGFRIAGDTRTFSSSYFIPTPEVDECALTKLRSKAPGVEKEVLFEDEEEGGNAAGDETKGDIPDSTDETQSPESVNSSECVKNWKAARTDNKKRVMGMFDETGIFASVCRHGLILWVTDMVRSGEQ